ncbi:MAG: hypothetical protein NY202_05185 [Mollicutes bacterium UO1]
MPKINVITRKNSLSETVNSKVELLDRYYVAAKSNSKSIWKKKAGSTNDEPDETDPNTMEIETDYWEMRKVLEILGTTYTDTTQAEAAKTILKP